MSYILRNCGWYIDILKISELKPHEGVYPDRVEVLAMDIKRCGYVEKPILVDENTMTILNGHHRVAALRMLGARRIPAVLVDYFDDNAVKVYSFREEYMVTKHDVIYRAKTGNLYPPRTSRHVTFFDIPSLYMDISLL